MKIEHLRQLLTIVEEGSMNRAAQKLYIARSSISSSMKNLKDELGAPIFERGSRGVRLTQFGTDVYYHAKEICEKVDFLHDLPHTNYPMQLGVSSMYCSIANDAFAELCRRHSGEPFVGSINESMLNTVVTSVAMGLSELGIVTLLPDSEAIFFRHLERNGLEFHKLYDQRFYAIVGPQNPLYRTKENMVTMENLTEFPYIVIYGSPSDFFLKHIMNGHWQHRAELQVNDRGCAFRIISLTTSVAIDSYYPKAYGNLYASNPLRFLPIDDLSLRCKTGWIKQRQRALSPVAEEFLTLLKELAEGEELSVT